MAAHDETPSPEGDVMSETVERVAQEICDARARVNDCEPRKCSPVCPWCMASAVAAIAALRESTPEMIAAGATALDLPNVFMGGPSPLSQRRSAEVWRAMIDAVLRDKP